MPGPIVVYDACVLYSAPLRDLLLQLAMTDLVRARWTDEIHEEWIRNVLRNRPDLTLAKLQRTRELMDTNVLDCLVHGYNHLTASLKLPDSDDRHVLAAAIKAGASAIITTNLRHFPGPVLKPLGVVAEHPDSFVHRLLSSSPDTAIPAIRCHRERLRKPAKTPDEYVETLSPCMPQTVKYLRKHLDRI
jgi:predicted nucleic acid-binding protein